VSAAPESISEPDVTIVIPAFNEERYIAQQLAAVRRHTSHIPSRIVVADNHSTDRTVALARSNGADEVLSATGTVAAVRNAGAARACGSVLIFMDADVFPTQEWAARLPAVIASVARNPMLVTGSWVSVPPEPTWIEKYWFEPLENGDNSHINSGHLIVSREMFARLRGFDEGLRTGEDFDFSVRARALGGQILDDPTLKVIHAGYPKRLGEFMRREIWHGTGDCRSPATFLRSKVALVGCTVLHVLLAAAVLALVLRSPLWLLAGVGFGIAMSAMAAFVRYRRASLRTRLIDTVLYNAYFLARGLSPYAAAVRAGGKKSQGASRH
jgi:GT2 family glycosyltransferase